MSEQHLEVCVCVQVWVWVSTCVCVVVGAWVWDKEGEKDVKRQEGERRETEREGEIVSKHTLSVSFVASIQNKTSFGLLKISNVETEKYNTYLILSVLKLLHYVISTV